MIQYSGKIFTEEDLNLIRKIIADNPAFSRSDIARKVCDQLNWRKPDGGLKDMRCRAVMIQMQKDNLIKLPKPRWKVTNKIIIKHSDRTDPQNEITSRVDLIGDIKLTIVKKRSVSSLWNEYIDRYHYLGFKKLAGAQMRYIAYANNKVIACLGFGASAWKTAPRDKFIGWSEDERKRNLHLIVNNNRFLILPWVKSKNLASKLLSMIARRLPDDWRERYNYEPALLETFVESQRFTGICYKAANWIYVGKTKGRGRYDVFHLACSPIKDILLLPIKRDFRKLLCA